MWPNACAPFAKSNGRNILMKNLKACCLAPYEIEKAQGSELPAIIGALREYIELEEDRLSRERGETYRRNRKAERLRLATVELFEFPGERRALEALPNY